MIVAGGDDLLAPEVLLLVADMQAAIARAGIAGLIVAELFHPDLDVIRIVGVL